MLAVSAQGLGCMKYAAALAVAGGSCNTDAMPGVLEAIYRCAIGGAKPSAMAETGVSKVGIDGDRYAVGAGTFSGSNLKDGRAISAIAAEVVDEMPQFADGLHRRNLVIRGIDLADMQGKKFRIGTVLLEGIRGCPPCGHLSKLTGVDAKELLHGKGGLRCDVVEPGVIKVGDTVELA